MFELMIIAFLIGGGAWLSLLTLTTLYLIFAFSSSILHSLYLIYTNLPQQPLTYKIRAPIIISALIIAIFLVH
jgi:hypothetical protein